MNRARGGMHRAPRVAPWQASRGRVSTLSRASTIGWATLTVTALLGGPAAGRGPGAAGRLGARPPAHARLGCGSPVWSSRPSLLQLVASGRTASAVPAVTAHNPDSSVWVLADGWRGGWNPFRVAAWSADELSRAAAGQMGCAGRPKGPVGD